jgi:hypothetical protein
MAKPHRLIAATARITAPRKPTRRQLIAQQRQAQAWKRKADESEQLTLPIGSSPEQVAKRQAVIAARLAELELDRMYDDEEHHDQPQLGRALPRSAPNRLQRAECRGVQWLRPVARRRRRRREHPAVRGGWSLAVRF